MVGGKRVRDADTYTYTFAWNRERAREREREGGGREKKRKKKTKKKSKENAVGPVYKIKREECDGVYVGETERSLKARFSEHPRPSLTTSEVSKLIHFEHPGPNIPWSWGTLRY